MGSEARFRAAEGLDCMMKLQKREFLTEKQDTAEERKRGREREGEGERETLIHHLTGRCP